MDVRDDTTTSDGGLDQGVELLVTTDGQLQMTGGDALHLEILAGIPRQFQDFGRQILENGARVHGRRGTDAVALVYRVLEKTMDTTNGKLQSGLAGTRLGGLFRGGGLAALATLTAFATFS